MGERRRRQLEVCGGGDLCIEATGQRVGGGKSIAPRELLCALLHFQRRLGEGRLECVGERRGRPAARFNSIIMQLR